MPNGLDSYTPSILKFSSSKLYFQHQNQLLQNIGFISPISIDIHFKYTFQEIQEKYFIEGGEFEGLTVDHDVHEQGIIYKIGFLNPKFQNIQHLSIDLKNNIFDNPSIWPFIGGLLGWGAIFVLLAWLYSKGQIWHVLFWINIVGGGILFIFCLRKIFKVGLKRFLKTKKVDYGGLTISYTNQSDALILSPDIIKQLKKLAKDYRISNVCYTGNCIYLLQDVHDYKGKRLSGGELYSEQEKAKLEQRTISYLHQPEFLSLFSLD